MRNLLLILLTFLLVTGCIKNDIPFPYIELNIDQLMLEGQKDIWIDKEKREVTIEFDESVDLSKVKIERLSVSNDTLKGFKSSVDIGTVMDLREPQTVKFNLYQEFVWKLSAKQSVERYFNVVGQVGPSEVFPDAKKIIANVAKGTDLSNIQILSLKLGLKGAVMEPDISTIKDFSKGDHSRQVKMTRGDVEEIWTLYINISDNTIVTDKVYPWVRIAWLNGSVEAGKKGGFEYCLDDGTDNWIKVDSSDIVQEGMTFRARLGGLQPATKYRFRAISGASVGKPVSFQTAEEIPLPNGNLNNWHKNGNAWNPWEEGGSSYWDTGNSGVTTLGNSNSLPSGNERYDQDPDGNGAKLFSRFVGLFGLGKFAAGNLYVGKFVGLDGTNGILDMGREFSSFPVRLTGYYKFQTGPIDYTSSETKQMRGEPDTCSIYIALGDWDEPVRVRTKPSERKLFDKNDPHVIAYAEFMTAETTASYQKISLDLKYRELGRTPKYMIIVISASKYGDFFTGSTKSILWVDEFQLEYE